VLWIGLGASAEILRAVEELKQDFVKDITQIKDAVVTDVSYRTGSSVQSDDFTETFDFIYKSLDITNDCDLLSNWANGEFEAFKEAVKEQIFRRLPTLIAFANAKDELEVSSIQPELKGLLDEIIPLAFARIAHCEVEVGKFEYNDARIKTVKGRTISFHGKSDLSCLVQQYGGMPICGFENKISKKSLILKKPGAEDANAEGRKAMSQTASQILGAVRGFHGMSVSVPAFTQIGTNGWQFLFVRRAVMSGTGEQFVASIPVALGVETVVNGNACVAAKGRDDSSFDLVAHMIGLMFDNARFLVMKLACESSLTVSAEKMKFDERYDDDDDDEDDDEEAFGGCSSGGTSESSANSRSSSSSTSSSGRTHNRKASKSNGSASNTSRSALTEINPNYPYLIPTASALRYHNSFFSSSRYGDKDSPSLPHPGSRKQEPT
jgi:hypothetical protein